MAVCELHAVVRLRFCGGDVEEFTRSFAQRMDTVSNQDTGTLQYDTEFNEDQAECVVIERSPTSTRSSDTARTSPT
jgi:hypothetical protein